MKKTKGISIVLMITICVGLLAGCGGSKDSAGNGSVSEAPPANAAGGTSDNAQPAAGDSEYNGPKVVIKVGLGAASTGHSGIALTNFKNGVEARCGGNVEVQAYADSQLGSEREVSEGVSIGTVEMSTIGMGTFATFYEKLQFVNTPFLLSSREQSYKFYDGEFMNGLNEEVKQAIGIRILGYGENGTRGLSNNVREIKSPADMAGLKIRVQENPLHIGMINELGASATPIAFAELYTSLSQKTVDGQDNGIPLTVNNRFYEVQPYYTTLAHCIDQLAFIANDDWFNSLDPVLQKIIQEEVDNWKTDIRQLAADYDISGIETMEAAGVTVTELTDEERQAFTNKMEPVYETARGLVGEEFFNSVLEAVEKAQ